MSVLKALLFTILVSATASANGEILAISGQTWVNKKPARSAMAIAENDLIETGPKSVVIIAWKKRSIFKLEENSALRLYANPRHEGVLQRGSLYLRVQQINAGTSRSGGVYLKTFSTALSALGQEFYYAIGRNNDVWIYAKDGRAVVRSKYENQTTHINAGMGAVIERGRTTNTPAPLPWADQLNWNFLPSEGDLTQTFRISSAYTDPLDHDYD